VKEGQEDKKRTRMKGEERHEFILAHAKHVFACYSYPEASTSLLAKESDITEPMLYKHFGSKKGLFLEVLRTCSIRFLERWEQQVNQRADKDILDALSHVILDYATLVKADIDTQKVFFQAIAESRDPVIAQYVSKHNQKIYAFIAQLLEEAKRKQLMLPDIDINAICWGYMSMVFALQYSQMLDLHESFNEEVLAEMNHLWLRALRP
jgi:AcrR family transcriptional regulator